MNFSQGQENDFKQKDLYVGKDNFKVVAVNPDNKTLKDLGLFTTEVEPEYRTKQEVNGKEVDVVNITLILQSLSTGNLERLTYRLVNANKVSSTGKVLVINEYGGETWLEESALNSKVMPDNMQWYITDGVKKQVIGEKNLIDFIRALRRIKNVNSNTPKEDRENSKSIFYQEDLDKIFKGDFKDLRALLLSTPDNSVCFNLGVRINDENKKYQDIFKELPMQSWQKDSPNNDFLKARITEAQQNGRYANTYFDLNNFNLKKYNPQEVVVESPSLPEEGLDFLPDLSSDNDFDDIPF